MVKVVGDFRNKAISASNKVEVEVEAEAELGNNLTILKQIV